MYYDKVETFLMIYTWIHSLNSCHYPLVSQIISVNGKIDFKYRDFFHQTHINNLVHLNRSRCFYKTLFKKSHKRMGVVVREPTPIEVPKDLKHAIKEK